MCINRLGKLYLIDYLWTIISHKRKQSYNIGYIYWVMSYLDQDISTMWLSVMNDHTGFLWVGGQNMFFLPYIIG